LPAIKVEQNISCGGNIPDICYIVKKSVKDPSNIFMQEISNILFDLGNVIIDIDIHGAKERLLALLDHNIDQEKMEKEVETLIHNYEKGIVSTDFFIKGLIRFAQPGVAAQDVRQAWNSMLVDIPRYRLTMLEKLKQDFTILALSNTNPLHIEWVYNHLETRYGILDFEKRFFHEAYYSHIIGYRKPNPSAFQFVIDREMITPGRTLFIDDYGPNIKTANSLGFQTVHLAEDQEVAEVLKLKGYY
jgi:putative hydrolase of the HAD superfamily